MRDPPDRTALLALHHRLLSGDRLASEELSCLLLPALAEEMARRFPRKDEQLIADGAIDAVLDYITSPQRFDTGREVPLDRFLADAAWKNIHNLLTGERRRKQRERIVGSKKCEPDVALDPLARKIQQEEQQALEARQAALLARFEAPRDRELLALILQGVRATGPYARVLDIADRPLDWQRQEVKRHKDRITRFLRRKGLLP